MKNPSRELVLKQMNRVFEKYLDRYGTDGMGDFRQFMITKGIPVSNIEFAVKIAHKTKMF
ncbi:hypothetical protein VP501E541_P0233 [Vibrio phage 501E54-1]|nr:hypothetical protein VP501E541_P0233 [Vibrio phage 501E54-1]